ncbi:MAG: phospholipase D-like domain-containing protein, partial [Rhabdochlamydiaceae bacterium]
MRLAARAVANHLGSTADEIRKALPKAQTALFSVAYGTFEGLNLVAAELKEFLGRHGRLRAILDIDRHFTDPFLIDDLYTMPGDVGCKLFGPRIKNPSVLESVAFHSKIYYFDDTRDATAIVGSSNLSTGGLIRNYETSIVLHGEIEHPVFVSLRKIFDDFWGNPNAIDTSLYPKFREAYAIAYAKAKVLNPRPGIPMDIPLEVEPEVLAELQQEFGISKEKIIHNTSAYIAGLIAGGLKSIDLTSRTLEIKFQRGIVNPTN